MVELTSSLPELNCQDCRVLSTSIVSSVGLRAAVMETSDLFRVFTGEIPMQVPQDCMLDEGVRPDILSHLSELFTLHTGGLCRPLHHERMRIVYRGESMSKDQVE